MIHIRLIGSGPDTHRLVHEEAEFSYSYSYVSECILFDLLHSIQEKETVQALVIGGIGSLFHCTWSTIPSSPFSCLLIQLHTHVVVVFRPWCLRPAPPRSPEAFGKQPRHEGVDLTSSASFNASRPAYLLWQRTASPISAPANKMLMTTEVVTLM